ncbi:MAG: hypothetical protein JSR18_01780 [Proteobacteria bacterium]|nr:hypothetical protein [Pseudomonadota bacterium]
MAAQAPVTPSSPAAERAAALRRANLRVAVTLATIAAVFFVGIIGAHLIGGFDEGTSVLGIGVLLFLAIAIGRNVFGKR